jgi:hypothetical protein
MQEISKKAFDELGEMTKVTVFTDDGNEYQGWILRCSVITLVMGAECGEYHIPLNKIASYEEAG